MVIENVTDKIDTIGFGYEKLGANYGIVAVFKKMSGEPFIPGIEIGNRIISIDGRPSYLTNLGAQGKY